jgi:hypothetical protein
MSAYNYFIENNVPFVFRYKYSNPNIIRTVFIKEHKEDKGLIITSEAITCKIKSFKTDGIHFDTNDLLPDKYVSVYDEALPNEDLSEDDEVSVTHFYNEIDEDDRKCNDNKHQFLKYAIENNKTIAFEHSHNIHVMSPYRFCNFGKSVLMYDEKNDMFRTYDIEEIRFVRIPPIIEDVDENEEEVTEDVDESDENEEEYLESSCYETEDEALDDDEFNTSFALEQSETFRELNRWDDDEALDEELDISAIDEINEWE